MVRELYGVVKAQKAAKGIIVTSGTFSSDAERFAKGKEIELVGGTRLLDLVADVQNKPQTQKAQALSKTCPNCGRKMVLRTARKGTHAGEKFWGCTGFPECRTILPYKGDKIKR